MVVIVMIAKSQDMVVKVMVVICIDNCSCYVTVNGRQCDDYHGRIEVLAIVNMLQVMEVTVMVLCHR